MRFCPPKRSAKGFYTEIGNDVLLENDRDYQIWEMSPLERKSSFAASSRMTPSCRNIISLVEQLLSQPSQAE